MSDKIYIKRSVKEKLPTKDGIYHIYHNNEIPDTEFYSVTTQKWYDYENYITHWLEEVPLEEYLKEIGLEIKIKESNECEECKKSDSLRFDGHRYICTRCEIDL